jgi:hypothetical protein
MGAICLVPGPAAAASEQGGTRVVAVPAQAAAASDAERRARTKLRLDDGQQDFVVALADATGSRTFQAVILNRFTPTSNRLPLELDTVQILFPKTCQAGDTGLRAGMTFEALVYLDPSGSGDPASAMLVARQPFEVRPSDTEFQRIRLETPVTVTSGDVWVGYTNAFTATDTRLIYHAALDTSSSKGRSWIFYNGVGSNFDGDVLANAQFRRLVDDEGVPGNWMIRALNGGQWPVVSGRIAGEPRAAPTRLPPATDHSSLTTSRHAAFATVPCGSSTNFFATPRSNS